jgi:nucleoside-diphosphate-sugar epimerase
MTLTITGASGFVGQNLTKNYATNYNYIINKWTRKQLFQCSVNELNGTNAVIHLAGKAHDLKNTTTPKDYYLVNTELTKKVFDAFLGSEAKVFIFLSSVKAIADESKIELTEEHVANPITHYGKSKLLAEQYIFSKKIPEGKRVYILRPCMIHGPGNKGNLNLLYQLVSKSLPWPLGIFQNQRSFCSINNLCYAVQQILERDDIPSGVYNLADDETVSTNEIIQLIASSINKKAIIFKIPKIVINTIARIGDMLRLPLNTERLDKLTENFVVSNAKIKIALKINKFPISATEGFIKTFSSFNQI